ncbi:MAG: hypothetical protein BRD55_08445 [Bacteroidetes bacterium SW_9_63_38]|nr:MAG: hypothetical protein BRD55_08445 [Bacteroidetes bacterium SW_9_63_38]
MSYLLPPGESALTGACAFGNALCVWAGRAAYHWQPDADWTALSAAPTTIDSGFPLQSGLLVGADTHVGFLPADADDWAWWADLSTFSDAHPMYGDLLLCSDRAADTTYSLFSIAADGLPLRTHFAADELADPVAGWSAPTNAERLLLIGDGGLWALSPPYTTDDRQHLVSFDGVELPAFDDIPGPFQPGVATVVIPRRSRTALRLDLSDGSGYATGLKYLPGSAALWTAYLNEDRAAARHLLDVLTALPGPCSDLTLHDVLADGPEVRGVATSAGLHVPSKPTDGPDLSQSPLDPAALSTWGLWLGVDGAVNTACRLLCNTETPDYGLAESLRIFAGTGVCSAVFDLLDSSDPPTGPTGDYDYPFDALRALVAPLGDEAASLVHDGLSAPSVPVRTAACAMAGATRIDHTPPIQRPDDPDPPLALWPNRRALPVDALRANMQHDHPAVQAAAQDTCARLGIPLTDPDPASPQDRPSVQSSQKESPK